MRPKLSIMRALTNQDGSVLIILMVVVIATTALGVTMMNLGNSEIQLVTNEKVKEDSFYDADACSILTARFLRHLGKLHRESGIEFISAENTTWSPGVRYPQSETATGIGDYLNYDSTPVYLEDVNGQQEFVFQEDIEFIPELLPAMADIRPMREDSVEGTASNQQNAGYSAGIGTGGAGSGGSADMFIIACEGYGSITGGGLLGPTTRQGTSRIYAMYRRIMGNMSGGL